MNTHSRAAAGPIGPSLDETTSLQIIEQLLAAGANPNPQLKLRRRSAISATIAASTAC